MRLYACERCGKMVKIRSKGLCPSCRSKETPKKVYRKKKREGLSDFFGEMIELLGMSGISYTGRSIYEPSVCNVCHILPKRIYKSVAKERMNIIFLTEEEHTLFDRYIDCLEFEELERVFGTVWKIALRQVKNMYDEGLIKEKGRLLSAIEDRYQF